MSEEATKVAIVQLGCPKNLIDGEVMAGLLARAGFSITPDIPSAQAIIVNTCGFIESAKRESIDAILRIAEQKSSGRCRLLIAAGCLAQRYPRELLEEISELDGVVGTGEIGQIAPILSRLLSGGIDRDSRLFVGSPRYLYDHATPRLRSTLRHWAYVKIAEGCQYRCTFCAIPMMRGDLRSRSTESILKEAEELADQGVVEINLICQDIASFGKDRTGGRSETASLLRAMRKISGIRWIRLLYNYPHRYPEDLLAAIADEEKVVKYFDLPLQHIDDRVLRRMNRLGNSDEIRRLIDRVKRAIPGVILRTTFIVGFPGETEEEFGRLEGFLSEVEFDRLGVFTYSEEEGTKAAGLSDDVPAQVKGARRKRLLAIQKKISRAQNRALVGQRMEVLIDGLSSETDLLCEGRTAGQAPEIDGVVYINDAPSEALAPGRFATVEITAAHDFDLVGRIVG